MEVRCPWLPVREAREPGQTAAGMNGVLGLVCLGTEEDEASKPPGSGKDWVAQW